MLCCAALLFLLFSFSPHKLGFKKLLRFEAKEDWISGTLSSEPELGVGSREEAYTQRECLAGQLLPHTLLSEDSKAQKKNGLFSHCFKTLSLHRQINVDQCLSDLI